MRKIILSISFMIALVFSNTSCSDYLNIVPEGTPSMDNAFSNRINTFKYLHTCYSYLPTLDNGSSIGFLAGDEHWLIPKGTGNIQDRIGLEAWEIGRGNQNSNSPVQNYWDGDGGANNLWIAIRDCNIFLENIHKPRDIEDYERDRWISEVKFLKAYYHFFLFQLYGPIPIVDKNISIDATVEEVRMYREPVDEVVSYISGLLDESSKSLPLSIVDGGEEMGRITKPIAKAVKAQLLLLAASPLFNGNVDYAGVKDNKGRNLFPAKEEDPNKWKLAADAALDAINIAIEAKHDLFYFTQPTIMSEATRKMLDIGGAVTEKWNQEIIWGSTRDVTKLEAQAMAKLSTVNNYWGARSVLSSTLTVAEGFYSSNGVPISEDKSEFWNTNYPNRYECKEIEDEGDNKYCMELGQQTAILHFNREPRFYASLAFDRGIWYGSGYASDKQTDLSKYRFRKNEHSGMTSIEDHSETGYLNKKVCSFRCTLTKDAWTPYRYSFPIIRLSDLYLMHAEALNETMEVPTDDVFTYIDLVRKRAGLEGVKDSWEKYSKYPDKPNKRTSMREIIRMERLNELSGEGKRYWDLRRWKKELPNEIRGWNVKGDTPETFYRVTVVFTRPKFTYKEYLWPIKVSSIQRNPNLEQNPGW